MLRFTLGASRGRVLSARTILDQWRRFNHMNRAEIRDGACARLSPADWAKLHLPPASFGRGGATAILRPAARRIAARSSFDIHRS